MKLNNNQILSEAVKYYEDFGNVEESLFNWLIERAKKAEKYKLALNEIAKETGTPYVDIVEKALED